MSEAAAAPAPVAAPRESSLLEIFGVFLQIGATSFGGGVIAYLRNALVKQRQWMDDATFLELMSISNTLPGLNATNMSILAGNRLKGAPGAFVAILGMCLPGFVFMTVAGILYGAHGDRTLVTAALKGVAAAAVGLIAATWYQLGKKSIHSNFDAVVILLAVVGINQFKLSVPVVLLVVGALAIYYHRPGAVHKESTSEWINSLR